MSSRKTFHMYVYLFFFFFSHQASNYSIEKSQINEAPQFQNKKRKIRRFSLGGIYVCNSLFSRLHTTIFWSHVFSLHYCICQNPIPPLTLLVKFTCSIVFSNFLKPDSYTVFDLITFWQSTTCRLAFRFSPLVANCVLQLARSHVTMHITRSLTLEHLWGDENTRCWLPILESFSPPHASPWTLLSVTLCSKEGRGCAVPKVCNLVFHLPSNSFASVSYILLTGSLSLPGGPHSPFAHSNFKVS